MSLESKSKELKAVMATYNSDWLLGALSSLIHAGKERAGDQLGELSSPMRQLYYLAGLNVSSAPAEHEDVMFNHEKWNGIVKLLNEIEKEYDRLFVPAKPEDITDEWKRIRQVAMPSFLAYFNQGPLNYEEQVINWIEDLFTPQNALIEGQTGVSVVEFIRFYLNLDQFRNNNFQAHTVKKELLRPKWETYTKIKMGVVDEAPDFIKAMGEENKHMFTMMSDHGIIDRFYPKELVSDDLPVGKVESILLLLSTERKETDFLYYTATRPGNPFYEKPILNIGGGMYQVFEVKQVIHAIETLLEKICTSSEADTTKYVKNKGKLLEERIVALFKRFFNNDCTVYTGYFVDGFEQDILILWKKYAFIIEAKGYNMREPLRDPDRAFKRINDDFKDCIGYGYEQTRRVERKFIDGKILKLHDRDGKQIAEIDTTEFEEDFSIIVNLKSFGQIQCDLSTLIKLENEEDIYPWAVKLDDLEIFLLTMIAKKKPAKSLVDFLLLRETMHSKLICSDELEICGGFVTGDITQKKINAAEMMVMAPDLGNVFDQQYEKGMGFKNELRIAEKKSGQYIFW